MQSGLQESKTEAWEELLFSPLSWLQRTDKFGFLLLLLLFFVVLFNLFFVGPEPFFLLRTFVLMVYFFVAMTLTLQQLVDLRCGQDEGYELSTGTKTSSTTTVFYHKIFKCEFLYIHIVVSNFKGLMSSCRDVVSERMFNTSQGYMIGGPGLTVEIDESMFGSVVL